MKHLFLGGSKHGEFIDVPDSIPYYRVPIPQPFAFRDDEPPKVTLSEEIYERRIQELADHSVTPVAVYLRAGARGRYEFSRWLREMMLRDDDDEPEIVLEAPPHIQVSVGGRTVRWFIGDAEAVIALQSFVQAMGPGKEVS